jgi:hypothetical protein
MEDFLKMSWDDEIPEIPLEAELPSPMEEEDQQQASWSGPTRIPYADDLELELLNMSPLSSNSPPDSPRDDIPQQVALLRQKAAAPAPSQASFAASSAEPAAGHSAPASSAKPAASSAASSAEPAAGSSAPTPSAEAKASMGRYSFERWRSGVNGGKQRYGNSGGSHREYYAGLFRAKRQGKMSSYIREHGPPPARKGKGKGKDKGEDKGNGKGKGKGKDKGEDS